MNVPKIDNPGPVKQGRHEGTQSESALNCMVLQPLDDYGTYHEGGNETYVERWKGPITAMLHVDNGFRCMGVTFNVGAQRPNIPTSWVRRFPVPSLPSGWFWMVESVRVEEEKAGDHGVLNVAYVAKNSEWNSRNADGSGKIDDSKESWSLDWQTRNATALIYLSRKYGKLVFKRWLNPAVDKDGEDYELTKDEDPDMATFAKMAIDAMRSQTVESRINLGKYQFVWKDAVYELPDKCFPESKNVNPKLVVDKYIAGVSPVLHYPVLRKVTVANFRSSLFSELPKWDAATGRGGDPIAKYIDHKVDFPTDCPFEFHSDLTYEWVKVADNFSTDRTGGGKIVYTRTEVYWGDLWWDEEYYSKSYSTRWEIGGE